MNRCDSKGGAVTESGNRHDFVEILDVPISLWSLDSLVRWAIERIRDRKKTLYTTANANAIVLAQRLPELKAHFRQADAVLPDGFLPVFVSRFLEGPRIEQRISGSLFFERFAEEGARHRLSLFFLGSTQGALERICFNVERRYPGLRVIGTYSPPFRPLSEEDDREACEHVNRARPDALFVGMSAPKQELFLSRNYERLEVPFMMGIGAVFDYLSGDKIRPPEFIGRLGLEWAFRLAREPRRLWRRNLNSLVFLAMVARSFARNRDRKGRVF